MSETIEVIQLARPQKCRRICALPGCETFEPANGGTGEPVEMTLDEYETIRLIDLLALTQEEAARQMGVARTTAQAVYDAARRKLAQVLVEGRKLVIRGGTYTLCPHAEACCGRGCRGMDCRQGRQGACGMRRCSEAQNCMQQEDIENENRGNL